MGSEPVKHVKSDYAYKSFLKLWETKWLTALIGISNKKKRKAWKMLCPSFCAVPDVFLTMEKEPEGFEEIVLVKI